MCWKILCQTGRTYLYSTGRSWERRMKNLQGMKGVSWRGWMVWDIDLEGRDVLDFSSGLVGGLGCLHTYTKSPHPCL